MSVSPLRVIVAHRPPLAFVEGPNSSAPIFSGFLVDLLPALLQQANVDYPYELQAFQGAGGIRLQNGSWTGVMGQLVENETDIALFPLTLTTKRAQYIQHTDAFMDDGYGILIKTRKIDTGYSFLLPFQPMTWVLLLLSLVAVMFIISVLDYVSRRARFRAIERAHGVDQVRKVRKRDRLMGHAIETVMMAVGSGSTPTSRSCSVKVMFVAWAIFSVIMLSAYTANLTANLTVNQMGVTIRSLSDLAQFSAQFGVPAESSVAAYFKNSSDKLAVSLRPRMVAYPSVDRAVQAVRDGRLIAYINDYSTVQYYTQEPPCDLALGTETVGTSSLVIGLAANSTFAPAFNTALLQLGEAGYLSDLRRKWFVEASHCTVEESNADGNGRLALSQAWSVFMVLVVGAGVALIVAVLEILYYRTFFHGVQKLKHDLENLGPRQAFKRRITKRHSRSPIMSHSVSVTADLEDPDQLSINPANGKDIDTVSYRDQPVSRTTTGSAAAPAAAGIPLKVNAGLPAYPGVAADRSGSIPTAAATLATSGEESRRCSSSSKASGDPPKLTSELLQQVAQQQPQQPPGGSFSAWYTLSRTRSNEPVLHQKPGDDSSSGSSSDGAAMPHKK